MALLARIVMFMVVMIGVTSAYHWLLIDRLVTQPAWGEPWSQILTALIILGGFGMPASVMAERFLDARKIRIPFVIPAMLWMGGSFLAFSGVVITDVLHALTPTAIVDRVVPLLPFEVPSFEVGRALLVGGGALVLTLWGIRRAMRPVLERVEVSIRNWPSALDGLRIVQLTDIHIGPTLTRKHAAYLTQRANELKPDLIVITGDLVDGNVKYFGEEVTPFGELEADMGTYFVTGNHDFYSGVTPWCEVVQGLGIQVLRNQHVVLSRDGASFALAGVDDHRGDMVRGNGSGEDLEAALEPIRDGLPRILLAHDPATFNAASRMGVDLQISGHTHAGQIWPFRYAVRMTTKWVSGLYSEGPAQIYVSRGTGFWGPPVRVGAPAEITELTIRRA